MTDQTEKDSDPVRVGVFVCHCGSNIAGLLDCESLAKYAKTLPNVEHSENNLYTCSETGLSSIKEAIKEHNLNRVIVASCTPRTHEPLFRECISEEGLNPYLFNFVNLREQVSWVHMNNPEEAFDKAKDLIRMGVSKAEKLEPLDKIVIDVNPSALVIGGGVAGMSAALNLSNQGFQTFLVEKESELGGRVGSLFKLFPHDLTANELVSDLKNRIGKSSNLITYLNSKIKNVDGFVGNYDIEIVQEDKSFNISVGTIIVAVGASLFTPAGLFGYDGKKSLTQYEFEQKLADESFSVKNVVMIQCVGSRIEERPYCSSVCCATALKNALICKERDPSTNVTILFRDLYTPGTSYEEYYRKAREKGILFIRYPSEQPPVVEQDNVVVFNQYLNENVAIPYDTVILSTPLVSNDDNKNLAQLLKVPLEANKFFLEAHVKLRPNDFATDGVYVCGAAKWPVDVSEAITQGYAAAGRASTILSHETIEVEGATSFLPEWNKDLCLGCEVCINVCPYKAIIKNENDEIEVIQALCKGCGVCGASCTKKALVIRHFTNEQIMSEIYAFGGREVV